MSLYKMVDGDKMTMNEYATAFADVRAGKGSVPASVLESYLINDPKNAAYLYAECLDIAKLHFLARVSDGQINHRSQHIAVHPGIHRGRPNEIRYVNRINAAVEYDKLVATMNGHIWQPDGSPFFIMGACLFCGEWHSHQLFSVSTPAAGNDGYMQFAAMFDWTSRVTADAVTQMITQYNPRSANVSAILGICRHCYKPCAQCGARMSMPRVTFDDLEGYMTQRTCSACGSNSIVRLPAPKPSSKELRSYRNAFKNLGKEGA